MTDCILTLDVGTSSLRTMLYDRQGVELPHVEVQIEHQVHTTPDGGSELDPAQLFTNTVAAIDGVLAQAPHDTTIVGVAMSTLWHSVLGLDGGDTPLTPLSTWGDTRAVADAAALRQRLDERAVQRRTGCRLHPSYLPARLSWVARTQPDLWSRVARWVSFGEYLHRRLFGRAVCSLSMASGTGLLDVHRCTWDSEVLSAIGLDAARLSPLGDSGESVSGLRGEWATRWPQLATVPWFPAIGDGACSNLGSGCLSPHQIALMVGTSSATRVVAARPDVEGPPALWLYRVDAGRPILGGALSEGGNLLAWLRTTFRLDDLPQLDGELAALDPDAHGLTMLPFLSGERSPGWAAHARGAIDGLTMSTRPIEVLRAALEAIAYRIAIVHRALNELAAPDAVIVASGGALLHSPAWLGIMADVLGRRIVASGEREASSRGAALLALERLGMIPHLAAVESRFGTIYEPNPLHQARYQAAIARQSDLYDRLVTKAD